MISKIRRACIKGIEAREFNDISVSFLKHYRIVFTLVLLQCCRYAFQIVLQMREMLRALPSLVDVTVPNGKHFTVCGDVHGQVISLYSLNCFEWFLVLMFYFDFRHCWIWMETYVKRRMVPFVFFIYVMG